MRQSIAVLTACAALAVAQNATDTIKVFFPGGSEGYPPVASIVSANAATTAMRLTCPTNMPDYDDTECGWGPGLDYTVVSTTTYIGSAVQEGGMTMSYSCVHSKTEVADIDCDVSAGGPSIAPTLLRANLRGTDAAMVTATITAGADSLKAASTISPPAPSGSGSTASGAGVTTGSAGPSPTGSAAPAEGTGAAAKYGFEGSALLALAGAAALNVW